MATVKRADLFAGQVLALKEFIEDTKENRDEIRRLRGLGIVTFRIMPGQFAGQPPGYAVDLTERAVAALKIARGQS